MTWHFNCKHNLNACKILPNHGRYRHLLTFQILSCVKRLWVRKGLSVSFLTFDTCVTFNIELQNRHMNFKHLHFCKVTELKHFPVIIGRKSYYHQDNCVSVHYGIWPLTSLCYLDLGTRVFGHVLDTLVHHGKNSANYFEFLECIGE